MEEVIQDVCGQHSGCIHDIDNLKEETVRQGNLINKLETKLNMILGAAICSPFLVALLTYLQTTNAGG